MSGATVEAATAQGATHAPAHGLRAFGAFGAFGALGLWGFGVLGFRA